MEYYINNLSTVSENYMNNRFLQSFKTQNFLSCLHQNSKGQLPDILLKLSYTFIYWCKMLSFQTKNYFKVYGCSGDRYIGCSQMISCEICMSDKVKYVLSNNNQSTSCIKYNYRFLKCYQSKYRYHYKRMKVVAQLYEYEAWLSSCQLQQVNYS